MAAEEWNEEWSAPNYEWPTTPIPDVGIVERLGKRVVAFGGRAIKEAHADRGVVMSFPNGVVPGTHIRKQIPRAECRRRAQIMIPHVADDPLKACIVCDAVHLWPSSATAFS